MCKKEKSQIRLAVRSSLILALEVAFFSKLIIVDKDGLIRIISWIYHFRAATSGLLITFTNSLDPDQDRPSVGPDLDPNSLTL